MTPDNLADDAAADPHRMTPATRERRPIAGGRLVVGTVGSGPGATLDPVHVFNAGDLLRAVQICEPLFVMSADLTHVEPVLAESAEPSVDRTTWTLHLRSGVRWHDGSPLRAADVVHTFNYWADSVYRSIVELIDRKNIRIVDDLTIEIPLHMPCAEWPSTVTHLGMSVVKAGTKRGDIDANPVGTGPFRCKTFTRGGSTLTANRDYWREGRPYLDELIFDTSYSQESDRLDAFLRGDIDVMPTCSLVDAQAQAGNSDCSVLSSASPWPFPLVMRVDEGQFADARVRRAMKLIVDRQAMIDTAWSGLGSVGNDLFCQDSAYPFFASDLSIHQDLDEARHLLRAAGADGATFELTAAQMAHGVLESAAVFAEDARRAGITIRLNEVRSDAFYTPEAKFMERSFSAGSYYAPVGSITATYLMLFSRFSTVNETHWGQHAEGEQAWNLIDQAVAATDAGLAQEIWHEVQLQQFDEGGFVIWGNADAANLVSPRVNGLREGAAGWLDSARFSDAWIG